jgi:hypothetical protein
MGHCPELVDGVLLYVDGDKAGAQEKIRRGAAQNAPEELRKFAKALDGVLPSDSIGGTHRRYRR